MNISNELKELLSIQFKIKKILWFGLTIGILIYFAAIYFITLDNTPNPDFSSQADLIIKIIGLIFLIVSFIFRKITFSDNRLRKQFISNGQLRTADLKLIGINSKDIKEKLTTLEKIEKKIINYVSRQQIFFIINLGINDSIAILGIAIGFISKSISMSLPYIFAALILNIWIYPRGDKFIEKISQIRSY